MKKILSYIAKYLLPLLLGVGIFVMLYKQLSIDTILSILHSDMNVWWVVLSMVIGVCGHVLRSLRWRLQLRAIGLQPRLSTVCNAVFGMYAFNLVLPRFGELWRCTYMAGTHKASFSLILGSVAADRFADMVMVILITLTVFLSQFTVLDSLLSTYPQIAGNLHSMLTSPWLYAAIVAVVAIVVWLWRSHSENRWMTAMRGFMSKLWNGFSTIATMRSGKVQFVIYTILIWTCYLLQLYVCFFAFDWMSRLGIAQALVLFVLGSIGMLIPVQGGIGPWHAAVMFGLSLYGIGQDRAGAFALVAHGSQMLVTILLGIYTTIAIFALRRQHTTDK